MALQGKLSQQAVLLLLLIGVLVLATSQPNNLSCDRTCGSFKIPYPFGTTKDCYLDPSFLIICNHSFNPPKPFLGIDNIDVLNISLDHGELRVSSLVIRRCKWYPVYDNRPSHERISALLNLSSFRISPAKNSIFAFGCNLFAYIKGSRASRNFIAGCVSLCDTSGSGNLVDGSCSGLGCCHSDIPKEETNYNLNLENVYPVNSTNYDQPSNICGLGFIGETKAYNFSTSDFENLEKYETINTSTWSVPLVLDWAIGNTTCKDAKKNRTSYFCKAMYSKCFDANNGLGYLCNCFQGYQGNPYVLDEQDDSCRDIDECNDSYHPKPCHANAKCTNTQGSYKCTCPKGYKGDGHGTAGCSPKLSQIKITIIALELLTGEKALSMDRPESERNLAMYFGIAIKEDRLLQIIDDQILKEGNIEEIKEVANIAKRCLNVRGEDRPSMKQVTKELEGLRPSKKGSLKKVGLDTQQTKHLPNAPSHSMEIDVDIGSSSMTTIVADDSMINQIVKPTDNDAR